MQRPDYQPNTRHPAGFSVAANRLPAAAESRSLD